jgi:exonuclease III
MNRDTTRLRIVQYNVGRRYEVMAHLPRLLETKHVDVIAIQESWIKPHNESTHNPAKNHFHTVLTDTKERPRVCVYIHRGIDTQRFEIHEYESRDIISVLTGAENPVLIHNMYNLHTDGSSRNRRYNGTP